MKNILTKNFLLTIIITIEIVGFFNQNIYSQQNYSEITLPNNVNSTSPYLGNTPREIIYADNKIFVYSVNKISVFNSDQTFQGEINFNSTTKYGRFALKMFDYGQSAIDYNFMYYVATEHKLFYLTPDLEIKSIITNNSTYTPVTELSSPSQIPLDRVKKLYVFNKFEISNDKLIWLIRTKSPNMHSWDSYLGIYNKNAGVFSNTPIYSEFLDGSSTYGYDHTISNFGYYGDGKKLFVSRSVEFEVFQINQDNTVSSLTTIATTQRRFGKFLLIKNLPNTNPLMLALPFQIDYEEDNPNTKIYQFDVNSPANPVTILAPNSRITDAEYDGTKNELLLCYPNDEYKQIQTNTNHDFSVFTFNQSTSTFDFDYAINTNSTDETDVNYQMNINLPLDIFLKANGEKFIGKKNEIVKIQENSTGHYESSLVYYSKNAYLSSIVETQNPNTICMVNNISAGLEFFDSNLNRTFINMSHPVYNTEYNPQKRELYLFNRLGADHTGFYVYNLDNEEITNYIELDKAIGDLAYNSVQGHVLVSVFDKDNGSGALIRVFDANNNFNELTPVSFSGKNYPSEIYCAPNNKIYIGVNMLSDDVAPKVEIISSFDYTIKNELSTGFVETYLLGQGAFLHYSTIIHFAFNPYNKSVYFAIGGNYCYYPPYQISKNNGYFNFADVNLLPLTGPTDGKLREITEDDNLSLTQYTISSPGELICAKPKIKPSKDYLGKLYINGLQLYTLDCNSKVLSTVSLDNLFDIEYNPNENCLYAYQFVKEDMPNPTPNKQWIKIYKVNSDNTIDPTLLYNDLGFASSITYNKYDDQLYLHYISGYKVMGESPIKIITINPNTATITNTIYSNNTSLFPEVEPIADYPFIDPYTNKAFFPNGMHSNVGVVSFNANEPLLLTDGTDWLSIPRMNGNTSTTQKEGDLTSSVFNSNNFEIPYTEINQLYHWHTETANEGPYLTTWDDVQQWKYDPNIDDNKIIYSFRGYQLDITPDGNNVLYMSGNIKDPMTQLPLYARKNNWLGYFLPQEQDIFDALGSATLDKISEINAKNYYCYRSNDIIIEGPIGGQVQSTYWVCDQQQTNIAYGDMVQLLSRTYTDYQFTWQNPGKNPREKIRPEPDHFQYNETAAYTPIIIELNYTNNPLEIGAFVNDSCVGAEALMPEDSTIILKAYLNGASPDSIVFADWFGTKSSEKNIIKKYYVFNEASKLYERKSLYSNTTKGRIKVSFKDKSADENKNTLGLISNIGIWPNPVKEKVNFSFDLIEKSNVKVEIYGINGKLMSNTINQDYNPGLNSGSINLIDNNGKKLSPGIYMIVFDANGFKTTNKLIIQ